MSMKVSAGSTFRNKDGHFIQVASTAGGKIRVRVRKGPRGPYSKTLVEMTPKDFRGLMAVAT